LPSEFVLPGLRDSKLLSAIQRERMYCFIAKRALAWAVGVVDVETIDAFGIQYANTLAMNRAVGRLAIRPEALLIDALKLGHVLPTISIIDGDAKVRSIAAASVMAKVTRDYLLSQAGQTFPDYGFARHKGYGTEFHSRAIKKFGVCEIHRKSFQPIRLALSSTLSGRQ
ncbi:MAG: ribonuclease HII, partial [bacterium]|nr:ribonuclease HII [bacterium]